ncbi:Small, acid-soluble spore protein, alpha/beta type [compost metagenome]
MPRRGGRHYVLVKGAERAMEAFKLEIATDLGLAELIDDAGSYHNMTTLQVGQIGGEMVRRITAAGQYAIMKRYDANEERLMPEDVLPSKESVRSVSNNGNPTPHAEMHDNTHTMDASDTGQSWKPHDNDITPAH